MTNSLQQHEESCDAAARETCCGEAAASDKIYVPRADVLETDGEFRIYADLPGVEPADLELHFEDKELKIHGKVKASEDGGEYVRREYGQGDYERSFKIGEPIDAEQISAELKNGVLTVHLPKAEAVKTRRIDVSAN